MTDTDSLFYEIKTDDVYKDIFGKDSKYKDFLIPQILIKQIHITQRKIKKQMGN